MEKTGALDHYKHSNYGFERNERVYAEQLARKVQKQAVIHVNALSPNQKWPTHTLDTIIKDQALNDLATAHVQQKQKHDDQVLMLKTQFRKEQLNKLNKDINA